MNGEKLLLSVAVIAVGLSIIAAGITYFSVSSLVYRISGLATGEANLTVETLASVNFSTRAINWSSGRVNIGSTAASLITTSSNGDVTGGNWTVNSDGLILENVGNVNVSLNLSVGKNASEFIGGTNPAYEWNLTAEEAASCVQVGTTTDMDNLDEYHQANTTNNEAIPDGGLGCSVFRFESGNDLLRLDFNITIPENSLTGKLGDVITATVTVL